MAKPKVVATKKEPFRIFEAGPGVIAKGIIKKAAASEKKGRNREFTGVDISLGPNFVSRWFAGHFRKMPGNLTLTRGNAIKVMAQTRPRSQSIVFESYLLNNVGAGTRKGFFKEAKRILRPGGRLVLVQDMSDVLWIKRDSAKKFGAKATVVRLSDKELSKSKSTALKERSSRRKRMSLLKHYRKRNPDGTRKAVETMIGLGIIEKPEDYVRPVLIVIQKPRKKRN